MSEEKKVVQTTEEAPQELKRGIKGWQVAFIGLGGVIGSCYFPVSYTHLDVYKRQV